MAIADTANLVVQLRLDDKLSGGLARVNTQLRGLQAGVGQMGRGFGQVGAGLARVGSIAATGFAVGVGAALKVAGDFEAQLNTIGTIAVTSGQTTQAGLKDIGDGIRALARETGAPLDDLTHSYYDLLSAGIKVSDAQEVLRAANQLSVGAIGTNSEAVDVLTTALNSYNLTGADATRVSDEIAEAVAAGKTTLSEIAPVYAQVAPLAAQFGIGTDEVAAALGRLTALGNPAAETTTQMSRAILELIKPQGPMLKLQERLGVNFAEQVRKNGLVATLQEIRVAADKLGIPFQDLFGRLEGYRFAVQVTGDSNAAFVQELDRVRESAGLTAEQFSERQQGLNFQLGVLKANLKDAGITIGTALMPKLVPLVKELNAFIQANQGKIGEFGQKLADGLGSFADRIKGIDFSGVIDGLKILGDVGKKVVDIFLSLPKDVQGMLVAGFAINKLSGGLLAKGAGNIVGGLAGVAGKLIFERGNSPMKPLYVQNVGGPGGLGGGTPGGGLPLFVPAVALAAVALATADAAKRNKEAGRPGGLNLPFDWLLGSPFDKPGGGGLNQMETAAAVREGTAPLVSEFARSRATSADLNRLVSMEDARRTGDAARMLDQLRSQTTGINQIAAKNPVIYTNVKLTSNVSVSVSNVVRTITSYTAALGSGPGGAVSNPY